MCASSCAPRQVRLVMCATSGASRQVRLVMCASPYALHQVHLIRCASSDAPRHVSDSRRKPSSQADLPSPAWHFPRLYTKTIGGSLHHRQISLRLTFSSLTETLGRSLYHRQIARRLTRRTWRGTHDEAHLTGCTRRGAPDGAHLTGRTWRGAHYEAHITRRTLRGAHEKYIMYLRRTWRGAPDEAHLTRCTWRGAPDEAFINEAPIATPRICMFKTHDSTPSRVLKTKRKIFGSQLNKNNTKVSLHHIY